MKLHTAATGSNLRWTWPDLQPKLGRHWQMHGWTNSTLSDNKQAVRTSNFHWIRISMHHGVYSTEVGTNVTFDIHPKSRNFEWTWSDSSTWSWGINVLYGIWNKRNIPHTPKKEKLRVNLVRLISLELGIHFSDLDLDCLAILLRLGRPRYQFGIQIQAHHLLTQSWN